MWVFVDNRKLHIKMAFSWVTEALMPGIC